MPSSPARLLLVAALLTLAAGRGSAELIHFSYTWQASIDAPSPGPGSVTIHLNIPQNSEPFSGSAPLVHGIPYLQTQLRYGEIRTSGGAGAAPLTLDAPVHTVFNLTDTSSGESAQVRLEGRLSGTVGVDFSNMHLSYPHVTDSSGFPLPSPNGPAALRLGGHLYRIWFFGNDVPPVSLSGGEIAPNFGPLVTVSTVPEPSGLTLAATAAGLAACRLLRRRWR
jgi:hypothetical protein